MKYECKVCGECCRHLDLSELYSDLDLGDGTCKYLTGNLCKIYNERPLKCRVEESYYAFFSHNMSKEAFYQRNYEMCEYFIIKKKEV